MPRPEIIVYPNSGEFFDSRLGHRDWRFKDDDDMKVLEGKDAKEFNEHGATVIGGCCRVTSTQIEEFAKEFAEAPHMSTSRLANSACGGGFGRA